MHLRVHLRFHRLRTVYRLRDTWISFCKLEMMNFTWLALFIWLRACYIASGLVKSRLVDSTRACLQEGGTQLFVGREWIHPGGRDRREKNMNRQNAITYVLLARSLDEHGSLPLAERRRNPSWSKKQTNNGMVQKTNKWRVINMIQTWKRHQVALFRSILKPNRRSSK